MMKDVLKIISAIKLLKIKDIFTGDLIRSAIYNNVWFTEENVADAINYVGNFLEIGNLERLASVFPENAAPRRIAVVMSGVTPLASFRDFMLVLLSGNKFLGKLSPDDEILIPAFANALIAAEPALSEDISFIKAPLGNYDAIILNGNGRNFAVFEEYLGKTPHLIHLKSIGYECVSGEETEEELDRIARRCFVNFGRGNDSIRNLFVPKDYDFQRLLSAFAKWEHVKDHARYFNNYLYRKSACIIGKTPCIDTGFVILRKSGDFNPHVAEIFYHEYESLSEIMTKLQKNDMTAETMAFLRNL